MIKCLVTEAGPWPQGMITPWAGGLVWHSGMGKTADLTYSGVGSLPQVLNIVMLNSFVQKIQDVFIFISLLNTGMLQLIQIPSCGRLWGGAFQYKEILFSVTCKESIYIEKGPGFSIRRLIAMRCSHHCDCPLPWSSAGTVMTNFFVMF